MRNKYKIAYISATSELGGSEISLATLIAGLDREKFELLVALPSEGPLAAKLRHLGVEVTLIRMEPRRRRHPVAFRRSQRAIGSWLRKIQPHVVHVNSFNAPELAIPPATANGCKVVYHCRDLYTRMDGARAKALGASHVLVAITQCVADNIRQFIPISNIFLAYNDVDVDALAAAKPDKQLRRDLGWEDKLLIGIASRLSPDKGQLDFLAAAAIIARQCPEARFVIAGSPLFTHDNRYPQKITEVLSTLGLEDKTHFTGFVSEMADLYKTLDIVVLASLSEPFGLVVAEAMACSRPVVATRSGGPQEIITDETDGLLVPVSDPEAMAAACLRLAASPELRENLGVAACETIKSRFNKQEAPRIASLYTEMIEHATETATG